MTNLVTDFRNCHYYAFLLHSLGTAVTHPTLVKYCMDSKVEDLRKAEMVVEATEALLGESLDRDAPNCALPGGFKATDILKAKAEKNSRLLFLLHARFSGKAPTEAAHLQPNTTDDQSSPAVGGGDDASLGAASPEPGDSRQDLDSDEEDEEEDEYRGYDATEDDYERWLEEDTASEESEGEVPRCEDGELARTPRRGYDAADAAAPDGTLAKPMSKRLSAVTYLGDILHAHRDAAERAGGAAQAGDAAGAAPALPRRAQPAASRVERHERRAAKTDRHHLLLRWVDSELVAAGRLAELGGETEGFVPGLRDFVRYCHLLHVLRPKHFAAPLPSPSAAGYAARREGVVQGLLALGCPAAAPPVHRPRRERDSDAAVIAAFERERQAHQAFLAAVWAHLRRPLQPPSPPPRRAAPPPPRGAAPAAPAAAAAAAPADPIAQGAVVLTPAAAAGILSHLPEEQRAAEAAECSHIVRGLALPLRRALLHYAGSADGKTVGGVLLSREGWDTLCSDCGIDPAAGRWPPGPAHPPRVAAECLLRAAAGQRGSALPSAKLRRLLEVQVLPRVSRVEPAAQLAAFRAAVDRPTVQESLARYAAPLDRLFAAHAAPDPVCGERVMDGAAFLSVLAQARLFDEAFTASEATASFSNAQGDADGLSRHEFGHALAAVAAFKHPTPWLDTATRVDRFVAADLLPHHDPQFQCQRREEPVLDDSVADDVVDESTPEGGCDAGGAASPGGV